MKLHPVGHPLEPDAESLDALMTACVAFVRDHLARLEKMPASNVDDAARLARSFDEPIPEMGSSIDAILGRLAPAVERSFNTAGPGYMAFVPGGGIVSAALADFIALATNRYVGVSKAAPALARIESTVVRWLATMMGYGDGAGGVLTSGGSLSNLIAIATARTVRCGDDFANATLYASEETHHSVVKSARVVGFASRAIKSVPVDDRYRIDVGALERAIEEDRAAGKRPLLVVANAGTTNTGSVDPIAKVAAIAKKHGMWTHVDAAYGGFFRLAKSHARLFDGIESCDSITVDPHKGLFLPYGTGCLLVRDAKTLRDAHASDAAYLADVTSDDDAVNASDLSPELSREMRGLRLWLPIMLHGLAAFRDQIEEKLRLTRMVYDALVADGRFAIACEPELSAIAFRLRDGGDDANAALLARINGGKRVFLSSTVLRGKLTLRVCIVSFRTHEDRVREAIDAIRNAAEAVAR